MTRIDRTTPGEIAAVADEVFSRWEETSSVPGVAYGVVQHGRLVHAGGRGVATVGGVAPDADTVFRIASMTKSFTAAAVLLLRDEGALRLDDAVADHVPSAHGLARPGLPAVTVRDLLTMGAGLATDDPWGDRQESLPVEEFDALVAAGLSACWPPRTAFEYSNTGYALLGRVIESASGMPFPDVVRDRLCGPLGMADTGFDPRSVDPSRLATGYRIPAGGAPVAEPVVTPGAYSAMGGLLSTVADLARWIGAMTAPWHEDRADAVVDDPADLPVDRWSLREMQEMARYVSTETTTGVAAGTVVVGYGYGLQVQEHQVLGRIVAHSGGYPGFGSHMRWHPASGLGVVGLGNATYAPMHVPVAEVLERLVVESGAAHGGRPAVAITPWPRTVQAMDLAERLLDGDADVVSESMWSPTMDLDVPRSERLADLRDVRAAIGEFARDPASVQHATAARAAWTVRGADGSARLEILMTPERLPRIQRLTVTVLPVAGA